MSSVVLIYRKPNPRFFSIEKVFALVKPHLSDNFVYLSYYLPFFSSGIGHIIRNIWAVRKFKEDIVHITGDVHYAILGTSARKTILTIHDCVFMKHNTGIKRLVLYHIFLKWPVKRAGVVTAISEFTRKEIIQFTGCNPEKVIVIPNPVDEHIYYAAKAFNQTAPVLLFIGTTLNKNLDRVIEAIRDIPCVLDIIGPLNRTQIEKLTRHNIAYTNSTGLTNQQLADKYASCDIVLFPSTFEGFGLPILEGQKAGRVVITSNLSPMKEVGGDGVFLVDPFNVDSIRKGTELVVNDAKLRQALIEKGYENIKRYDAHVIAEQYSILYKRIAADL